MIEFTVELEEKILTVMADRVSVSDGTINLYKIRMVNFGCGLTGEEKDLVGSFNNYKNFYINGGSDE